MKFKIINISILFLILILLFISIYETQGELISSKTKFSEINEDNTIENTNIDNIKSNNQDLSNWSEINNSDIIFGLIFFTILLIINLFIRKNQKPNA